MKELCKTCLNGYIDSAGHYSCHLLIANELRIYENLHSISQCTAYQLRDTNCPSCRNSDWDVIEIHSDTDTIALVVFCPKCQMKFRIFYRPIHMEIQRNAK